MDGGILPEGPENLWQGVALFGERPVSGAVRTVERIGRAGYLGRYMLGSILGRKRPLLGGIKLTHRCNLNCIHCPFWRREAGSLTFPQAISALQALHGLGVRIVVIEGGEPFLWRDDGRDLRDVVFEAKKLFFSVGVTTNGTFPIETDADIVWVSVDGLQQTHDRIRGKTFERIMAHLAASRHPRIYAHITINALNWREVPELVRFLTPRVRGVTIQFHYPYHDVERDLFLPFPHRRHVLEELTALKRQGLAVADSYACLEALKQNRWRCRPWMIASVDPDGRVTHGCYVQGREQVSCERCGFSAHAEISLAYGGALGPIFTGSRLFALW